MGAAAFGLNSALVEVVEVAAFEVAAYNLEVEVVALEVGRTGMASPVVLHRSSGHRARN